MTKKIALISSKTRDSMVGKGSDQGGEQFTQVAWPTGNMWPLWCRDPGFSSTHR